MWSSLHNIQEPNTCHLKPESFCLIRSHNPSKSQHRLNNGSTKPTHICNGREDPNSPVLIELNKLI
uniref:Uncharacterized protein n=1 Tax=Physcomitrium patens TaxID=3218 RepID=A0A2K1KP84_PHYPA|nr:hypothetical protein PHYPA_006487 [Physcomitrium patens]